MQTFGAKNLIYVLEIRLTTLSVQVKESTRQTFVASLKSWPDDIKPKFELRFHIVDLNNVPLVSGTSSIRWHLAASNAAEHRGKTPKYTIKDHKVVYDYEKTTHLRLLVGKDGVLQESHLQLEVLQEYQTSGHSERVTLGTVKLNLAEYVDTGALGDQAESGVVSRRYLMQESKINSTLKVEISMKHIEGDKSYTAPVLRSAPVFGGIAGVIPVEASETIASFTEDAPPADNSSSTGLPSLSTKTRETGELQDMYRRTLAASWAAQPGEPRADECIEDIFAGGDGWAGYPGAPNAQGKAKSGQNTSGLETPRQSVFSRRHGWDTSPSKHSTMRRG